MRVVVVVESLLWRVVFGVDRSCRSFAATRRVRRTRVVVAVVSVVVVVVVAS